MNALKQSSFRTYPFPQPTGASMLNSAFINGIKIETNKNGMSINDDVIIFGDGSTYNTRTGAFHNVGSGYVKVNGRSLGDDASSEVNQGDTIGTKFYDFATTELSLELESSQVTVEPSSGPGMHVEVTGPKALIESIRVEEKDSTLQISVVPSSSDHSSVTIRSSGSFAGSFGRSVHIGGMHINSGRGDISFSNFSGAGPVTIKVFVPSKTPVAISTIAGNVEINDIGGPLDANIQGSADIFASSASGSVRINITGSGDVSVNDGNIDSLIANIVGTGDVYFGGTAQNAMLNIAGSGDITVNHAVKPPMKSVTGVGRIQVSKVG